MTITAWLKGLFTKPTAAIAVADTKTEDKTEMSEPVIDSTANTAAAAAGAAIDVFAANLKAVLVAAGKDVSAFDEAVALAKKA